HVGRGAQQHDRVEAVVEAPLVGDAARDEERSVALGGEELRDSILAPEPPGVVAVEPFAPASGVGLDRAEPAALERLERGRLARARHTGDEDTPHYAARSNSAACPWPTPTHSVASP